MYNQDQNPYPQQPYSPIPPQPKNNTATVLAVVLGITGALLIGIILVVTLFATGTIKFGTPKSETAVAQQTDEKETVDAIELIPEIVEKEQAEPGVQPQVMYISNVPNSVYFRSEPVEESGNVITTISRGTPILFKRNVNTEYAEISYNDRVGYVKREYLSTTQPAAYDVSSVPASENVTVVKYMYVANVENSIYLRSSAAENSGNIICTIPVGTRVGYIERTNGTFSKISYNGTIGYAKTKYLENSYASYAPDSYMTVSNVPHSIYLRSAPKEDKSNIICEIPVGSRVEFLDSGNGTFYRIYWNGKTGYAKAEYLR